jgi:uncharacterized membrane protein
MQYIGRGAAQKTCHPYSLRRASFEQASLTQSHYNFSFHTFLIIVMSAIAAVAVLPGCGCNQSVTVTVTLRLTVGRSVLVLFTTFCRSPGAVC